jgi:putative solute:sodium symporter small subunit
MATESNSQPRDALREGLGEGLGDGLRHGIGDSQPDPAALAAHAYWRANLRLVGVLLLIWFLVSFGFGILLVEPLNQFTVFGFKLGFWWAQQGSIYVFIALIFVYAAAMRRIDRRFDVHERDGERTPASPSAHEG